MNAIWDITDVPASSAVTGAFDASGFLVLRQALERSLVLDLGRRLSDEFDRLNASAESLAPELRRSLDRCEMPAHPEIAPFRLDPANFSALTGSTRLKTVLQALMGEDFLWHYPPMLRRLSARRNEGLLPYHQDYAYNQRYPRLWTSFTPLSDCGEDAPGLELLEAGITAKLPHVSEGLWESGVSEATLAATAGSAAVRRPSMRAGDVIIFNELTLHRTHSVPAMSRARMSVDARAVPLSSITPGLYRERRFIQMSEAAFHGVKP